MQSNDPSITTQKNFLKKRCKELLFVDVIQFNYTGSKRKKIIYSYSVMHVNKLAATNLMSYHC